MKIIFTITGLAMGGAENQVVNLVDELSRRGYQVILAYLLEPALIRPSNENVEVVWLGGSKTIMGMGKAFWSLARLIKETKPAVVHSHMYHANILTRLVSLVVEIPRLVCTAHSNDEGGALRMMSYRLTDRLAHVFTNVSMSAVKAFELKNASPAGRMRVVHNGIPTEIFTYNRDAREDLRSGLSINNFKVIIAIGRFHVSKDYPNLLEAFAVLCRDNLNVHLLIAGDGELRSQIELRVNELNLNRSVTLLGNRRDVPRLLSAADIFVLSSAWEGFGLVVAEAMATQRVVVATDAGGVAEVIGDAGFLVEPGNSNKLAQAMQKALSLDEQGALDLGQKGRKRIVSFFSLGSAADTWEKIYSDAESHFERPT